VLFIALAIIVAAGLLVSGCSSGSSTTPAITSKAPAVTSQAPATVSQVPVVISQSPPTQTAAKPKAGGTFTFLSDGSPSAGNIGWPPTAFTMVPQYMMYNSLVKAWWDGTITEDLATSWDIDNKAPAVTFHLRKGVKFHDGTDFNAQAVKYNFDLMIQAKKRPDWKSVDVIDDFTVRVNLTNWRNTIMQVFDGNPMVSPTVAKDKGVEYITQHPSGTGPFTFVEYKQDDHMTLKKNPNYWESGYPLVDTYIIKYVPDQNTRVLAMQKKDGDMMLAELGKPIADFKNTPGLNLFAQPQATAFMIMDDLNPDSPFYNLKVRQAVDYAIDRKWIADNLGYGYWQACYQISPRNNSAFIPDYQGRVYDTAKAKQLLSEAGYANGFKTSLYPNPTALNKDLWVAIQSQLAKVGITADLQFVEATKYNQYRNFGTWKNAIVGDNIPSYGNMNQSLLQDFYPTAEFFKSMNKSPEGWKDAIDAATLIPSYDANLTRKAEKILYDNVSVIPIAEGGRGYVYQNYVMDPGVGKRAAYFWAWDWEHFWLNK
jgi:peptide/nickel transport system substrate-binding protein